MRGLGINASLLGAGLGPGPGPGPGLGPGFGTGPGPGLDPGLGPGAMLKLVKSAAGYLKVRLFDILSSKKNNTK